MVSSSTRGILALLVQERQFHGYGVTVGVRSESGGFLDALAMSLPARPARGGGRPQVRIVHSARSGTSQLHGGSLLMEGTIVADGLDPVAALEATATLVSDQIARRSLTHIFIRGGAVAVGGRSIVLAGDSFAGTTTLVAALAAQGAQVLSDRFAVLDGEARVHPYPPSLPLRRACREFRAEPATPPPPIALVAALTYRPASVGIQASGPPDPAALLRAHTVEPTPVQLMESVSASVHRVAAVAGERGEAYDAARHLLEQLEGVGAAQHR
jgi:hypothetical protein